MEPLQPPDGRVRFGIFEMDLATGELRRAGVPIRLPAQPAAVLRMLVRGGGALVTREAIGRQLWHDRWEELEPGINTCISQIRGALGDSASSPTYIETVPRRGYRFIAPAERLPAEAEWPAASSGRADNVAVPTPGATVSVLATAPAGPTGKPGVVSMRKGGFRLRWPVGMAVILVLGAVAARALTGPMATADPRVMLAVLPFENLDGNGSLDYVGAGLTEELTTLLAGIDPDRLGVIARTSAATFHGDATVAQIGEVLGVDWIVEGGVRSEDGTVRITAQLIRVSDQSHVWADAWDRTLADVLDVQRDVARNVAGALAGTLVPDVRPDLTEPSASPARLPTAEARWLIGRGDPADVDRALVVLDSAITADPAWAPAWTARAMAGAARAVTGATPDIEAIRQAANRAIELDDGQVDAHLILAGLLYRNDWDWDAAEFEFRRALALAPGRADVHHARALFLAALGRSVEARNEIQQAMHLDPVSTLVLGDAAFVHYLARDYDAATAAAERVLGLDPQNVNARAQLVNIAMAQHQPDRMIRQAIVLSRLVRSGGQSASPVASNPTTDGVWRSWVAWWRANGTPPARAFQIAVGFAWLGQTDSAFAALEPAVRAAAGGFVFLGADPAFDSLRDDPRFLALLSTIGPDRARAKPASR